MAKTSSKPSSKTLSTGPKDVFLHLLMIVALFLTVISFLTLAFQYIDLKFPDPLDTWWTGKLDAIRWSSSMLIVVFPVFLITSSLIGKDFKKNPAKKEYRVRKWLLYFTLFVAAITIIVDLITLINQFYGGELTLRFFLKTLSVLVVAGLVFGYYLWDVNQDTLRSKLPKTLATLSSLIVLGALVGGFFIVGSPAQQRLLRFDDERENALRGIQSEIVYYYQQTQKLPETLETLNDPLRNYTAPKDPVTQEAYEYRVVEPLKFELCATFARPSLVSGINRDSSYAYPKEVYYMDAVDSNWEHEAGRTCFTRTIDPARIKPFN